jgi:4-hydroxy-3-polyprenylbenzoate decarboxylase
MKNNKKKRIVVAITGASGGLVGVRVVEILRELDHEVHLLISHSGELSLSLETKRDIAQIKQAANFVYDPDDVSASLASGSFSRDCMLIVPCSIKTLSAIANSYSDNLITRSADICLKEGKTLILGVRETPFHLGHIRLMSLACEAGAVIFPLIPPFYGNPQSVSDIVNSLAGRILLRCSIENPYYSKWDDEVKFLP